jgi:hypothetical protein
MRAVCRWFKDMASSVLLELGQAVLIVFLRSEVPLRTKMTPTHSEGSPGVMLTKTPSSCANRRLELRRVRLRSQAFDVATYNSTRSCCFRNDRRAGEESGRGIVGGDMWTRA